MDGDAEKRVGALAIIVSAFVYTFLCYFLSRVFRKVTDLQWEPEWAFIPFVNIYIITTKICHKSDVYFCCMGVGAMFTGIIGLVMWMMVMFIFGQRFNHDQCWSFWFLFLFPVFGLVNIALDDDAYYRLDAPILEPPEAVFRRVANPEYSPPDFFEEPLQREPGDLRVHFQVLPGPGTLQEPDIKIVQPDIQIVQKEEKSVDSPKKTGRSEPISMNVTKSNLDLDESEKAKMTETKSSQSHSLSIAEEIV